jgi:hypothetical protein
MIFADAEAQGIRGVSPTMIVDSDFIWIHFPKCAGTAIEKALHQVCPNAQFDEIDHKNVIWHDNIDQRKKRDPNFSTEGKKLICCIRRLPEWILSRIHFEAQRPPHHIATREMLVNGRFFENNGHINSADTYISRYNNPLVDHWIRVEHIISDLSTAIGIEPSKLEAVMGRENKGKMDFIKEISFWFTDGELKNLYQRNPQWAEIEFQLYGSLMSI